MLSNVEMKYRADNFIKKHKSDKYEKGEAQSYWKVEERIAPPNFTPKMKRSLIKACEFDWSEISPAIFGSIVQNTMDEQLRR